MRNLRLGLLGAVLAVGFLGCGGADVDDKIEESPYAPTQAQFDQMKEQMTGTSSNTGR